MIGAGIFFTGLLTYVIMLLGERFIPFYSTNPPFMELDTESGVNLFLWFPMFFFNIMGEELLWRGVILKRQKAVFGKHAWLVNASGWTLFHLCFGQYLLLTLLPIIFIESYVADRTNSTISGIVIHGFINGGGFYCTCSRICRVVPISILLYLKTYS